jgi:hypothetical protein
MEYIVDHNNFVSLSLYSSFVRGIWRRGMGLAYNYHLGNFLSATASYSIYNRSYSNVGFGLSVNLGPVEIYCLTDNFLAFGTLNPRDNFISNSSNSINIDTKKVRNGQIHFGLNLTFGREKKEKPVDDGDEKAVKSPSSDKNKKTKKNNNSKKGESKTKVEQSAPKSSTVRKVSRKL